MKRIIKFLFSLLIIVGLICSIIYLASKGLEKFNYTLGFNSGYKVPTDYLENGMSGELIGDLSPEEMEQIRQDLNAPTCDDVFEEFAFVDSGNYVIVYRVLYDVFVQGIVPNALFVKTSKGLIWDGCVGISADIETNWWTGTHDFSTLEFTYPVFDFDILDNEEAKNYSLGELFSIFLTTYGAHLSSPVWVSDNAVTFSDYRVNYCENFFNKAFWASTSKDDIGRLKVETRDYIWDNMLQPYFFNLDNAKMYADLTSLTEAESNEESYAIFNSYITYLYNFVKGLNEDTAFISLNDYFAVGINEAERVNYPIAEEDRAKYNNAKYYKAYNCNVVAECVYTSIDPFINRDISVIEGSTVDIEIKETPTEAEIITKLNLTLVNKNNSDLSNADLKTNPVTITIGDDVIGYNSVNELSKEIALKKNITYNYTITSNSFVFNSYSGSFTLTNNNQVLEIPFEFDYNYVETNIKLMPVSSVSSDDYDLSTNPVNIIFTGTNGEGTYQFVYSSNDEILTTKSMKLKKGSYSYSIESADLIFTSIAGNVVVDENNRNFTFSYYLRSVSELVGLTIDSTANNSEFSIFSFSFADWFASLVYDFYLDCGGFDYKLSFTNSKNEIYETSFSYILDHGSYVPSPNIVFEPYGNPYFENNETYTCQVILSNDVDPVIMVSNKVEITYMQGYDYVVRTLSNKSYGV